MHPIERLRYVARAGDLDATLLAQEAADALGSLAFDPRALVPACRRLIEFHPSCAPIWWVCARLLLARDVRDAAAVASELLCDDATSEELAAHFPAGATVVSDGGPTAVAGLAARPDLTIRLVATPLAGQRSMRRIDGDVTAYDPTEADDACRGATVVLLEPLAAGPSGIVVGEDAVLLAEAAVRARVDLWAVVPEGRLLPAALCDALVRHVGARDLGDHLGGDRVEPDSVAQPATVIPARLLAAVVTPEGAAPPIRALAFASCGTPSELLEPSRGM
jgi:hypothetical protein